jgi:hypothetical protein
MLFATHVTVNVWDADFTGFVVEIPGLVTTPQPLLPPPLVIPMTLPLAAAFAIESETVAIVPAISAAAARAMIPCFLMPSPQVWTTVNGRSEERSVLREQSF